MSLHSTQKLFWNPLSNFSGTHAVVFFDARNDGRGNPEGHEDIPCTFNLQNPVKLLWSVMW